MEEEWIENLQNLFQSEDFRSYFEIAPKIDDYYFHEYRDEVEDVKRTAFCNFPIQKENAIELSKLIGINQKIFDIVNFDKEEIFNSYYSVLPLVVKDMSDIEEDNAIAEKLLKISNLLMTSHADPAKSITYQDAVDQLITDEEEKQNYLNLLPKINENILLSVYSELTNLFLEPRHHKYLHKHIDAHQTEPTIEFNFFNKDKTPYFCLCASTTLSILRNAYWGCGYNIPQGDDDHSKIVATHIDFLLTAIERVHYYKSYMDFFSKTRLF